MTSRLSPTLLIHLLVSFLLTAGIQNSAPAEELGKPNPIEREGGFELPERLLHPISVTVDPLGRILIIDGSDGAIWVIDPEDGNTPQSFLASGQASSVLETPTRIFADWGLHVYTLDPLQQRISVFDLRGRHESSFDLETALLESELPLDVEFTDFIVDKAGALAVLDALGGRVYIFDSGGKFVRVLGEDLTGDERLVAPTDLETDPAGNLFIADPSTGRVVQLSRQGSLLRVWDLRSADHPQAQPVVMAYSNGILWVADPGEKRVISLMPDGKTAETHPVLNCPLQGVDIGALELATSPDGRLLILDSVSRRIHFVSDARPDNKR